MAAQRRVLGFIAISFSLVLGAVIGSLATSHWIKAKQFYYLNNLSRSELKVKNGRINDHTVSSTHLSTSQPRSSLIVSSEKHQDRNISNNHVGVPFQSKFPRVIFCSPLIICFHLFIATSFLFFKSFFFRRCYIFYFLLIFFNPSRFIIYSTISKLIGLFVFVWSNLEMYFICPFSFKI